MRTREAIERSTYLDGASSQPFVLAFLLLASGNLYQNRHDTVHTLLKRFLIHTRHSCCGYARLFALQDPDSSQAEGAGNYAAGAFSASASAAMAPGAGAAALGSPSDPPPSAKWIADRTLNEPGHFTTLRQERLGQVPYKKRRAQDGPDSSGVPVVGGGAVGRDGSTIGDAGGGGGGGIDGAVDRTAQGLLALQSWPEAGTMGGVDGAVGALVNATATQGAASTLSPSGQNTPNHEESSGGGGGSSILSTAQKKVQEVR